MKGLQQQRGASLWSVSVIVIAVGFFALLAMRLVPVYYEHYTIAKALDTLQQKYVTKIESQPATRSNLLQSLQRILNVNGIRRLKADNIKITWNNHSYTVTVAYTAQVKMMGNVRTLIDFNNSVVIPNGA